MPHAFNHDLPQLSPNPVLALFRDIQSARVAIETMLQGGFHGNQLGMVATDASVPSPANNLSTYRVTGFSDSGSPEKQDPPMDGDFSDGLARQQREMKEIRDYGAIVSVQPTLGQEQNAREMLAALGGRLLREDGSLETEAA
jgi:hypothetical protein